MAALEAEHGGTLLRFGYRKTGFFRMDGEIRAITLGEWGLRFWILLEMGFPEVEGTVTWDPASGALVGNFRSTFAALRTNPPAILWDLTDDPDALRHEVEEAGYFYHPLPAERARYGILRLNYEATPVVRFSASVASSREKALRESAAGLQSEFPEFWPTEPGVPRPSDARDAIRDVLGWNTVFDSTNHRWYTALSRNWTRAKFGGWGVWLDDVLLHAYLAAFVDAELAERNLMTALHGLTPDGNLPCLLTEFDEWVDRSQPPIAAATTWRVFGKTQSRALLEAAYPVLLAAYRWWDLHRDGNRNGLLEYGTNRVGGGMYMGTTLAAKNESAMDNSPMYDEVLLDPVTGTLPLEDVALNSLLVQEAECLAEMARVLDRAEEADALQQQASRRAGLIREQLWDAEREIFANRCWDGRFSTRHSPTSFYPLVAGAASQEQAEALVSRHLLTDERFGGPVVVPAIARDDSAFADNVYWRGRVWAPLNFWVYLGLRRYGYRAEARTLAERSLRLFWQEWNDRRHCHENYNSVTGEGCDSPDSDPFYTWGALLPLLTLLDQE